MQLIGLTGGIASGKSVVSSRLRDLGAIVIDADVLAREVVEPGTPGLAEIEQEFGAGVIGADGRLDRPALGAIVFSDPDRRRALEAITHPAVWARAKQLMAEAEAHDESAIVVYDVPLLAEGASRSPLRFDRVLVVDAPANVRLERLIRLRGMPRDDAQRRIDSQASDAERLAIADEVIDSGGTLDHTLEQVDALWTRLSAAATP